MARAARLRLRDALEEVIAENVGDNPRGHARGDDRVLIKQAQELLGALGSATSDQGDTPGRRTAGERAPSRATDSATKPAWHVPGVTGAAAGDGETVAG